MKSGKFMGLVFALLLSGSIWAQQDTLPHIIQGQLDWTPYNSQGPARMNQKDYAIYMVRMNGLDAWFESEPDQDWIQDFHFFDINNNLIPDAIYSGVTHYFKGEQTLLMFGDSSFTYPLAFQAKGYVHSLMHSEEGIEMSLIDRPGKGEYLVHNRHYYYEYAADSARLIWQLQYVSTTQIPARFPRWEAFTLRIPAYIRTTPAVRNEPGIDYDGDEKPDGTGNIIAAVKPETPLFRLWREDRQGENWSFVMLLKAPAEKSLFKPSGNAPLSGYCGWMRSSSFED